MARFRSRIASTLMLFFSGARMCTSGWLPLMHFLQLSQASQGRLSPALRHSTARAKSSAMVCFPVPWGPVNKRA